MPAQPLTPVGVQLKIDELYALPDPDLFTETESLRTNFQGWIATNFSLTTEQATYLAALNTSFVDYAAYNSAFALKNRLPITLAIVNAPAASKLVHTKNNMVVSNEPGGGITVTGSFDYEFEYL